MIFTLIDVVLPVFLIIGAGYLATRFGYFKDTAVDGIMVFAQNFAIPCLLFRAIMDLELGVAMDLRLLGSFYIGAITCFFLGMLGARYIFNRRPGEAVAIGFAALFSNSVLLGLPIMERAFGSDALGPNFAILAIHAPVCYFLGITVMEITRADGRNAAGTARLVVRSMFRNALMIGLALGFAVNFSQLTVPAPLLDAIDMLVRAALPTALFGLGGVLTRYKLRDKLGQVAMIGVLSLFLHPIIVWTLSVEVFALPVEMVRSAVLTAAMAPGANAYIFASMYQRGQDVNSSAVLILTFVSIFTATFWLSILP